MGAGQIFIVAVAILPGWFEGRRAIATGIAACGAAIGGVIYPIVFHRLQPVIGFPWAVRVMAFIMFATTLVSLAVVKMRTKPPPRPKIVDFTGFRELLFTLFAIICFVGSMGLYVPFFYISTYAAEVEGLNHELAFYMLPILASGGILGRIIPAVLADRVGTLPVLAFTTSVAAALAFFWILVRSSTGGIVVWSLFYGIFSGPFVSLQTPTIAAITPDMRIVGGRLGMSTFCLALGVLIGNPVAGAIQAHGSWIGMQIFAGCTLALSAVLTIVMMVVKIKRDNAEQS